MADVLLSAKDIKIRFGGVIAADGINLDVYEDEIRAIIGPNGAGKTTLLNISTGYLPPQGGTVTFLGHDAGDAGADDVRTMVMDLRGRLGNQSPVVVAITGAAKGRPVVVVATNEAARARGIRAGELVRVAATTLGGGGGGKDDIAQGGGQDLSLIHISEPTRPY